MQTALYVGGGSLGSRRRFLLLHQAGKEDTRIMVEKRAARRRECELPLSIVQIGLEQTDWLETTRNINANGGVCFHSSRPIELGQTVHYIVTLSEAQGLEGAALHARGTYLSSRDSAASTGARSSINEPAKVQIGCQGRVVRCRSLASGPGRTFEIAVTMEKYRFRSPDSEALLSAICGVSPTRGVVAA